MSGQASFPGFHEQPDTWGLTWNPKGEAPPATAFADSLPGSEAWADLMGANRSDRDAELTAVYSAYIASARWKVNSAPARARARGRCEFCDRECEKLEVHHLTYERFTRELPGDLRALCPGCHEKADAQRRAAWQRQLARWRDEAEAAHEEARFKGFLRAKDGDDFYDHASEDELRSRREQFDQWASGRIGDHRR